MSLTKSIFKKQKNRASNSINFFFLFSFSYEKQWFGVIFGLVTLFITVINYKNDNTVGSMWCWSVNSMMIYYAIYLLIYLPFLEKMNIC